MSSTFFGFELAARGLFASRQGMYVSSHNINNINTPGYSRQQLVQQASKPVSLVDKTGMQGTGVDVLAIKRVRDNFLDSKYWYENKVYGEYLCKSEALSELEMIYEELNGSGFSKIMDEYYKSLQELSKNPSDEAYRNQVVQKTNALAQQFNSIALKTQQFREGKNEEIMVSIDQINAYTKAIAHINEQIYKLELDGNVANDLRDQRGYMIDQLSAFLNIEVNEIVVGTLPNGQDDVKFTVTLNGSNLVNGFKSYDLAVEQKISENKNISEINFYTKSISELTERIHNGLLAGWDVSSLIEQRENYLNDLQSIDPLNIVIESKSLKVTKPNPDDPNNPIVVDQMTVYDVEFTSQTGNQQKILSGEMYYEYPEDIENNGMYDICFKDTGNSVTVKGGSLKALIDMRDGDGLNGNCKGAMYYIEQMNTFARELARVFNEIHIGGVTADGDTQMLFFTYSYGDGKVLTSDEFKNGSSDVSDFDYSKITAFNLSISKDILDNVNKIAAASFDGEPENNDIIQKLIDTRYQKVFESGTPEDYVKSFLSNLAIDSAQAQTKLYNQATFLYNIENKRLAISSVNQDEELANLVVYNEAFGLASKILTTLDGILDNVINRMGLVGR